MTTGYPLQGMLPFGIGKPLTDEQVLQVRSYVLSKRGSSPPRRSRRMRSATRRASNARMDFAYTEEHDTFRNELASVAERRPPSVGLRATAVGTAVSRTDGRQSCSCLPFCSWHRSSRSRAAAHAARRAQPAIRDPGNAVRAAGLLHRRHARADRARHDRLVHRRRRTNLVWMAVPANDLHGDAVQEDRVRDRWFSRSSSCDAIAVLDRRTDGAQGRQTRRLLRPVVRDCQRVPGMDHRRPTTLSNHYRPTRANISPDSSRSRSSAWSSRRCSPGSGNRRACLPVRTGACCRRWWIARPSR